MVAWHDQGEIRRKTYFLPATSTGVKSPTSRHRTVINHFYNQKNSITLFDPTKKNQRQSHKLTSRLTRWIFICIKRIIRCFCSIKQRIKVTTFFYLQFLFKIIHHHSHLDVLSIKLYFSNDIRLAFDFHTLIKFCYYMI